MLIVSDQKFEMLKSLTNEHGNTTHQETLRSLITDAYQKSRRGVYIPTAKLTPEQKAEKKIAEKEAIQKVKIERGRNICEQLGGEDVGGACRFYSTPNIIETIPFDELTDDHVAAQIKSY